MLEGERWEEAKDWRSSCGRDTEKLAERENYFEGKKEWWCGGQMGSDREVRALQTAGEGANSERSLISNEPWGESRGKGGKDIHCPEAPKHYLLH